MPDHSAKEKRALYRKWEADLPLFYQPVWLDAVCGMDQWQVALFLDGAGNIQAALPYWPSRRFGLRLITHPPLSPRMGPWLQYPAKEMKQSSRYDFEEKAIQALLAQLPKTVFTRIKCHPQLQNWYPFYKAGFRQTTAYTYLLNVENPVELWPRLEASTRNKIRKAKGLLQIEEGDDLIAFYDLLKANSKGDKRKALVSFDLLKRIDDTLAPKGDRAIYFAKDNAGQVQAANYIAYDSTTAYNLFLTTTAVGRKNGAATYLLWHAILQSARRVQQFDFEGSMLPGVERFFRGFGGQLEGYHLLERWFF